VKNIIRKIRRLETGKRLDFGVFNLNEVPARGSERKEDSVSQKKKLAGSLCPH
jgi:hypothetical protein